MDRFIVSPYARPSASSRTRAEHTTVVSVNAIAVNRFEKIRTFAQDNNASGYTLAMNRTLIVRPGFRFFFPLTTMILISLVVSIVLWLFRR